MSTVNPGFKRQTCLRTLPYPCGQKGIYIVSNMRVTRSYLISLVPARAQPVEDVANKPQNFEVNLTSVWVAFTIALADRLCPGP